MYVLLPDGMLIHQRIPPTILFVPILTVLKVFNLCSSVKGGEIFIEFY